MKDSHLTLRLPGDLARDLARWAHSHSVPKSHVVRLAVERFLAPSHSPMEPSRVVSGRELAARWQSIPRLTAEEADSFVADTMAGRQVPPLAIPPWE